MRQVRSIRENMRVRGKQLSRSRAVRFAPMKSASGVDSLDDSYLGKLCRFAGVSISTSQFVLLSVFLGVLSSIIGYMVFKPLFFILLLLGAAIPFLLFKKLSAERASSFSSEFPGLLLAVSSNMRAGLTVYSSLERAAKMLPANSFVRQEVMRFLGHITQGMSREKAVSIFAGDFDIPELPLFRRAFGMVIVYGGKFSDTLERLARVSRDRENLISSSKVSTASMRMTANVLIVVTPLLLCFLSLRSADYWHKLFYNPIASSVAAVGFMVIAVSYFVLRKMSSFKP